MLFGIREPYLVCGERARVASQTGVLQVVTRSGAHVVGTVAIGAERGAHVPLFAGLAVHAARIRVEDGIVTFAAWGSGGCVISSFGITA